VELIRCFVAVEIPDELKILIDEYISSLRKISPDIKWIKANNLHITLKFLGEIPKDLLSKIQKELLGISNVVKPFAMSIGDAGFFPNQFKPRVIWLGMQNDNNNSLFKIHKWIDEKLENLGFEKEKRRFSPHLTLGRIKVAGNFKLLTEYINHYKFHKYKFNVSDVILMKSLLKPSGAEYSKINVYSLKD
jgi:RNA 2',3'-cyclic 3'-phosphodiesterase